MGKAHSLYLKAGVAYISGSGYRGQLGNGSSGSSNFTKTYSAMSGAGSSGVTAIYAGHDQTIISISGVLYACGYNSNGQLGIGSTTSSITTLTACSGAGSSGVTNVSIGPYETLILKSGVVYGAGYNAKGCLGIGSTAQKTSFTISSGVAASGVDYISVGYQASHIIKGGVLYGCGWNYFGQLGDGTGTQRTSWVACIGEGTSGVEEVVEGYQYTIMRKSDALFATGLGTSGDLGTGGSGNASTFTASINEGSSGVTLLTIGNNGRHMAKDNIVYATGSNTGSTCNRDGGLVAGVRPTVYEYVMCLWY